MPASLPPMAMRCMRSPVGIGSSPGGWRGLVLVRDGSGGGAIGGRRFEVERAVSALRRQGSEAVALVVGKDDVGCLGRGDAGVEGLDDDEGEYAAERPGRR